MNEFELIARYFARPVRERQGIGDDCALIDVGDTTLAITTDSLTEHIHFFPDVDPASLTRPGSMPFRAPCSTWPAARDAS